MLPNQRELQRVQLKIEHKLKLNTVLTRLI
jgi:hypothetical protein